MSYVFQPRGSSPPKTAAERQRDCRARGKGRHRGRRFTKAEVRAYLAPYQARLAAIEAEQGFPPTPEQMREALRATKMGDLAVVVNAPVAVTAASAAPRTATWHEGAD
jgi:hypothetical protein